MRNYDTSETAIRQMSVEEQVPILMDAWWWYKTTSIETEKARLQYVKDAVPNPGVFQYADTWVKALEEFHHCWKEEAIEEFLKRCQPEELSSNAPEQPVEAAEEMEVPEKSEPVSYRNFHHHRKDPMSKVTKGLRRGAKKVAHGTASAAAVTASAAGAVARCAIGVVAAPVVVPIMAVKYYNDLGK